MQRESFDKIGRFVGCLVGLAVGDALGAPVEGMKPGRIGQVFGEIMGYVDNAEAVSGRPWRWRMPGLYTDDTQQALALADVLIDHGRCDTEALARLWCRMAFERPAGLAFGAHRGYGVNFKKAVRRMHEGTQPLFACGEPSAGNGAAMRIAPLGLFYCDDRDALSRATIEVSLLTHSDPRGIAGALAVARAVALLVRLPDSQRFDAEPVVGEIVRFVEEGEEQMMSDYRAYLALDSTESRGVLHQMSDALSILPALVREGDDALARKTVVREANRLGPDSPITAANVGFAPASVTIALYYGLRHRRFADGVLAAVGQGRDADTVGAMTGALLGARLGIEAIPEDWQGGLLNRDQITLRAEALATGLVDRTRRRDLVEIERELTRLECERRRPLLKALGERREREAKRRGAKPKRPGKAAALTQELPFAPPPETWLRGEPRDPVQAQRDKARRGRKRIPWKEQRRRAKRR